MLFFLLYHLELFSLFCQFLVAFLCEQWDTDLGDFKMVIFFFFENENN